MPFIELENINQNFGLGDATTIALDKIDLKIKKGEFISVMGPSGSGKTSLLNIIGLISSPTEGLHTFLDQEVSQTSQTQRARMRQKKVGFIFQNYNLLHNLTILENVSLPLLYSTNLSFLKRMVVVKKLLNRLGIHGKEFLYPHQLSGGQNQRIAIARALINQPAVILADEPTGSLDSANSEIVMDILKSIHDDGGTVIMATHNPILTKYAGRIIYIQDGGIRIDQKLEKNQQVDLGKMQDAIKKQDLRYKNKKKVSNQDYVNKKTSHKGNLRKAKVKKLKKSKSK